jgi:hypothetical protein
MTRETLNKRRKRHVAEKYPNSVFLAFWGLPNSKKDGK